MAYALRQSTSAVLNGTTNPTLAFPSAVLAGSLLVATINPYNQLVTGAAWSAGSSASPSLAVKNENGSFDYLYIYHTPNATAGAHTVQFTAPNGDYWLTVAEYTGIATSSPLDQTHDSGASANSASISSGATSTLAQAGELVVGLAWHSSNTGETVTATGVIAGGTRQQNLDNSSSQAGTYSDGRATATTGVAATWTIGSSQDWKAVVATFKETDPSAYRVSGQKAIGTTTGSTLDVSLPSTPTPGNYVIACVSNYFNGTPTVADTQSSPNSYTLAVSATGRTPTVHIYYLKVPAGVSGTYTVRATSVQNFMDLVIQEVGGLAPSAVVNVTGSNSASTGSPASVTASGASSQANSYAVAAATNDQGNDDYAEGTSGTPPWALVLAQENGDNAPSISVTDRIPTSATTETQSWVLSNGGAAGGWDAVLAVFKAATGGGGGPATAVAKRWDGSAWQTAVVKRWDGSAWQTATTKRY